jgi:hypothetical protein
MLNFDDILSYYPKHLHGFKDNILKKYLQHAKDIEPFLFDPSQKDRVLYFND